MTLKQFLMSIAYTAIYVMAFNYVSAHDLVPSFILTLLSVPLLVAIWAWPWFRDEVLHRRIPPPPITLPPAPDMARPEAFKTVFERTGQDPEKWAAWWAQKPPAP
jgi:hypothetical protein